MRSRQIDRVRRGQLLHARRETHRVALRGVVHAQVVADLADDDLAGVETHAHREAEPVSALHLAGVVGERVAQLERRVAGALRVILVGDRRAEERHDAVAGELVDEALEALDALGEDPEEALHDLRPLPRGPCCSASSIEPFTSAKSTVTCLRSPSRADLRLRIFSARCLGV